MHGRRGWRLGMLGWAVLALAAPVAAPTVAAEAGVAEAGDIRPMAPAPALPRRARRPVAPPAAPPFAAETREVRPLPAIDRPAVQPVGPGPQAAPVPFSNAQPPLVDRQPRPSIVFGVPTPPLFGQGETFTRPDSVNETARAQQGARMPSPGATIRLPIW